MRLRHILLSLNLLVGILIVKAQSPNGVYGDYQYAFSFDRNGNTFKNGGAAPRISISVITTNFGFIQSTASFMYPGIGGVGFHNSPTFSWAGYNQGRYVYASCVFNNCSYLSFAPDLSDAWVQYSFNNGNVDVYQK